MKKLLIIISMFFGISVHAFGQVPSEPPTTKAELLEKSKKQKKTGVILLAAGAGAAAVGGVLFASNFCVFGCDSSDEFAAGTGAVLFLAGVGSMIVSIPVLLNSSSNAKRAAELSVNTKPIYLQRGTQNGPKSYPALQLTIPLNRE